MRLFPSEKIPSFYLILILLFFSGSHLYAQQDTLTPAQKQARIYRHQGLELQNEGKIDAAISFYRKAIGLDPDYAVVYNDLGIMLEARGQFDEARQTYLKAIEIDPGYPNSYSNLALVYEEQGDFTNAVLCWVKRAILGGPGDPWAEVARKRLEDIARLRPEYFDRSLSELAFLQPQRSLDLSLFSEDAVLEEERSDRKTQALNYLTRARRSYARGEYVIALRDATVAEYLDPSNKEISAFVERIREILLR